MDIARRAFLPKIVAGVMILIFVVTAAISMRGQSSTWDEPYHLTAGVSQLQTGDPRLNVDHPPLARMLGGLPSLFMNVASVADSLPDAWKSADLVKSTNSYFAPIEDHLLWPGRICMLSLSILLGWLLYSWCAELHGEESAWFALALFAFCPVLLGNAALVMNDVAVTTFIFAAMYAWWRYLRRPSPWALFWVCIAVAAAFASKYSAVVLLPLFLITACAGIFTSATPGDGVAGRCKTIGVGCGAIVVVTLLAINAIYLFDGSMLTTVEYAQRAQAFPPYSGFVPLQPSVEKLSSFWPAWLPVPLPFYYTCGIIGVLVRGANLGYASDFLGQTGYGGWRNYFIVLLLIKLSIPTLILIATGSVRACLRLSREWWNVLFLALPPLLLIWAGSAGRIQIGIRHLLPAIPFLFLLATYTLKYRMNALRWALVGSLLIWNEASSLGVHPDYLMYFNFIGGGAEQGWRISVAGDDFGQGDAELARWLKSRNVDKLAYGGFGWGGVILNRSGIATTPLPCEDNGQLVAAHLGSFLLARDLETMRCYDWMRVREPDEKIGYNIFIYNSRAAAAGHDRAR